MCITCVLAADPSVDCQHTVHYTHVGIMQENADRQIRSSRDYVFPPFIIVERGESLNEWVHRVAPDFITSLFVLCHVTKRLQMLHQAGICHRDLKPGNILWRPTANAWTLIDFGCAEEIGALLDMIAALMRNVVCQCLVGMHVLKFLSSQSFNCTQLGVQGRSAGSCAVCIMQHQR